MYGLADLAGRGVAVESKAKAALREVIIVSLREDWSIAKLGLLTCLFGQLGNSKILVEFATGELFHEIGVWSEIEPFLVEIAANLHADPKMRLWALDGFVFNNLREGAVEPARSRIDEMLTLVEQRMPATSTHMRVFHYNWALAHFKLGDNTSAVAAAAPGSGYHRYAEAFRRHT